MKMNFILSLKNSFLVTALVSKDVKKVTFEDGKDVQESLFSEVNDRLRTFKLGRTGYYIYSQTARMEN